MPVDANTIAIVDSRFSCKGCGVLAALRGKDVLAMLLIADTSTLLLMIKDHQSLLLLT